MSSNPGGPGRTAENDASSTAAGSNAAYYFNFQTPTAQQRPGNGQPFNLPPQRKAPQSSSQGQADSGLNMGSMAGALPPYQQPSGHTHVAPQSQQRFPPSASVHQLQASSQFAGQTSINSPGYNVAFSSQFTSPFSPSHQLTTEPQPYSHQPANQQVQPGGPSPSQPPYSNPSYFPSPQQHQFMFYPTPYGQIGQSQPQFQGRSSAYPSHYRRLNQSYVQGLQQNQQQQQQQQQQQHQLEMMGGMSGAFPPQAGFTQGPLNYNQGAGVPSLRPGGVPAASRQSSGSNAGSIPATPRGPPRKPKQSGHALWVGNLPPGTLVTDLKDHFSRDATNEIESVFLISKSNCAFVNYRAEAACTAAMVRFHDSRFQGVRLVCRLRRSASAPAPGVPTGPAALTPAVTQAQSATEAIAQNREVSSQAEEAARLVDGNSKVNEKFFIVKSLTVEDLELSARNGIWATQAHNEAALNKAFETTENVYLIFSANKSGEYFGYARMTSPISDDASANLEWTPRAEEVTDDPDLPRSIPTPASEFAPKGRIIDDSARGTIFWEADPASQDPPARVEDEDTRSEKGADEGDGNVAENSPGVHAFGKPFRIEWLSTNRLPFYRTRGLRNPWNANREVKIARDGTELETSVGRRLIQMFHRSLPAPSVPQPMLGMPLMGYAPGRSY